jgi:[protein-PII] uridylyltransferase
MRQSEVQGAFIRLLAALAQKGVQILSAHVHPLEDQLAFVELYVEDLDFQGTPPAERIQSVSKQLASALHEATDQPPVVRKLWRSSTTSTAQKQEQMPIRVEFDNSTLTDQTIIDIFSPNRVDLLYSIARILNDMGAEIYFIKSAPYLDQVVSVFYVTNDQGGKIEDENRINELRLLLLTTVEKG